MITFKKETVFFLFYLFVLMFSAFLFFISLSIFHVVKRVNRNKKKNPFFLFFFSFCFLISLLIFSKLWEVAIFKQDEIKIKLINSLYTEKAYHFVGMNGVGKTRATEVLTRALLDDPRNSVVFIGKLKIKKERKKRT